MDTPCVVVASKTKETISQAQCSVPGGLTRACTVVLKIDYLFFLILFLFLLLLLFATVWACGPSPRLLKTALSFPRPSQQTMVGRFIVQQFLRRPAVLHSVHLPCPVRLVTLYFFRSICYPKTFPYFLSLILSGEAQCVSEIAHVR